jgi:peptidoglycan/xylan/chitin deacetylase (PgdA/CDA1 family)
MRLAAFTLRVGLGIVVVLKVQTSLRLKLKAGKTFKTSIFKCQLLGSARMQMSLLQRAKLRVARMVPVNPVRSKLTAPVASITFDDIPHSAARIGAPILESANVRGTYYVCAGHVGQEFEGRPQHEVDDLIQLNKNGHEIACHTFGHPDITKIDDEARTIDLKLNAEFMRRHVGDVALSSFAYPYGTVSISAKAFYARRFLTCRGVIGGVNSGVVDFSDLLAVGIRSEKHDMGRVRSLIDRAKAKNGWLIFFTHDVSAEPSSFGCTPRDLGDVIEALALADIETLPVKAAAARVMSG